VHAARMSSSSSDLLGHRLSREWSQLRHRPDALVRASGWEIVEGSILDLDQVLAALGHGLAATPEHESAMRRIVGHAATDQLAARVVLQRVLPGLLALVRRSPCAADQPFDELVGAAWISVTTFDTAREPRCLAAALIDDARHRAFRAPQRRASASEVPTVLDPDRVPSTLGSHPSDELTELFALATDAGVPADELDLLRRLLAARQVADVAAELGVTTRTVRTRRAAVTGRLRELALAA
jgi:hypothetical protein